jgi:DNA repair exonuclease SbcCD ATPase subunit
MTRTEFDKQVRVFREKKQDAILRIADLQCKTKEKIAFTKRQISELQQQQNMLKQQLHSLAYMRKQVEREMTKKFNEFVKTNDPYTTSNLADAPIQNIIYELRRRGLDGTIYEMNDETGDVRRYDIQLPNDSK